MSYHLQSEGPKVGTWTSKVGKLPSRKLTWKPKKRPIKTTVPLKRGYMGAMLIWGSVLPKNPEHGKLDQYSTDNRYLITLSLWNWSLVWVPRAGDPSEFIGLGILGS